MTTVIRGSDDFDTAKLFGKAQTLRNMRSPSVLRNLGTDYTNNTGSPVQVYAQINGNTGGSSAFQIRIDTNVVAHWTSSASNGTSWVPLRITAIFTVMPGQMYRIEDQALAHTIITWHEVTL